MVSVLHGLLPYGIWICIKRCCVKWVRQQSGAHGEAFPGRGQIKPEQREIERLHRAMAKLKVKRDPKRGGGLLCKGHDMRFAFIAKPRPTNAASFCSSSVSNLSRKAIAPSAWTAVCTMAPTSF